MCLSNLSVIGKAMQNYRFATGRFPAAAICDANGKPLLSWRVAILPYTEDYYQLYRHFHLNEAWDSPHNNPLVKQMPHIFQCPSEDLSKGHTTFQVVVDPRSVFTGKPSGISPGMITEKEWETLMVVEATHAVPWSKPEDLSLASGGPRFGIGSKRPGRLYAVMADVVCRAIDNSSDFPIDPEILKALITRNGREEIPESLW